MKCFWLLALALSLPAIADPLYSPDPLKTPGQVRNLTAAEICATSWGHDERHVTDSMRQHVAGLYGIPWSAHSGYEFDHLIPRELGGADTIANLWPQPYVGTWNARRKDRLENVLHKMVCAEQIPLEVAQRAIQRDWIAAYKVYVH